MSKKKSIIITAPSGAGKTTLVKLLLAEFPNIEFSVSATTRPPRANEVDGKDYYFLSPEAFEERIANGDFLEWEEVYNGTKYGTLKSEVDRIAAKGHIVIFDIDIMGALMLKKQFCQETLSIFIAPPDFQTLENRLRERQTETEEKIRTRLDKAQDEMKFERFFDCRIVNKEVDVAYNELKACVKKYF